MMFLYRPMLSLIVFAAQALYIALRIGFYHLMRRRFLELIEAKSRESTTYIETMRAVQGIKIFTREIERSAVTSLLKQSFPVANEAIFGLENVRII
jgi:ATP-binding cassette subfamily B protein RaxB